MEKMIDTENVIMQKISIIIDIMMEILNCSYSDAYKVIKESKTYYYLEQKDYSTMHDSPQANLASIGEELRTSGIGIGQLITDTSIKNAMISLRNKNRA